MLLRGHFKQMFFQTLPFIRFSYNFFPGWFAYVWICWAWIRCIQTISQCWISSCRSPWSILTVSRHCTGVIYFSKAPVFKSRRPSLQAWKFFQNILLWYLLEGSETLWRRRSQKLWRCLCKQNMEYCGKNENVRHNTKETQGDGKEMQ